MTNDQARKLLGGYATNSLTEAERTALFQAALDDQELFDALQHEEALRELLADPVSRNQVQQALAQAPTSRPAVSSWWSRGWVWTAVAGAVAATLLIVVVIRSSNQRYEVARVAPAPPMLIEQPEPAIVASPEPKRRQVEPTPRKTARAARAIQEPPTTSTGSLGGAIVPQNVQPPTVTAPPPPPPPVPAVAPRMQALRQDSFAGNAIRGPMAGAAGFVVNSKGTPLLRYSLVKRDSTGAYLPLPAGVVPQPGDAVRLNVIPEIAGYLSLYQLDPAGNLKRLFPASDPGPLLAPGTSQIVPDSPVIVTDEAQKFRLTLVPVESGDTAAQAKTAIAPLTVDITIRPGTIP